MASTTAASLPSLLLGYLTGSDKPTGAIATTDPDTSSEHAVDRQIYPEPTSTPLNSRPRPALPHTPQSSRSTPTPSPTKSFLSVTFGDEHMSYASDDMSKNGLFRENSFISTDKKRTSKSKTSYSICQPPPKTSARSKMHVRARPLLQLHQLTASSRPIPAFELLPTAIFSPALSRAIAKVFRTRHGLCPTDLAIVKADSYHQHEDAANEEDESRDVLALICKARKADGLAPGRSKIFLDDSTEWEAYSLSNGGYEFMSTDEHGLTTVARWVVKRPRGRRSRSASELDSPRLSETPSKKFNFSTISSNSRRHPVIATLTSTALDIQDSYNIPSPTNTALSPSAASSPLTEDKTRGEPVKTSAALRTLITASAVWVALREGWSPGFKNEDLLMRSPSTKLNGSPIRATTDLITDDGKDTGPKRSGSIARILRSASNLKRRSTASAMTDGSLDDPVMSRNSSVRSTTAPKTRPRAESASTVIIHRTTWPRPEMRAMRKHTGASNTTRVFGVETAGDMTEEEEVDLDSNNASAPTTPPKRMSAPTAAMASSIASSESRTPSPSKKTFSPVVSKEQKRDSSATDMTIEAKKLEANLPIKKKRRSFRAMLLCGMA